QTLPSANITLLNLQVDQVLQGPYAGQIIPIGTAPSGTPVSGNWSTPVGGVHVTAGKPSSIEMLIGGIDNLTRAASQPRANFDRYVGQSPTVAPVTVDFYRPGANNSELALTYASFATWRWTTYDAPGGGAPTINDSTFYVVYGLSPPGSFINALTGTASYQGVVYGRGSTREGARYDLGGRSAFLVDFSAGRYSGSLQVNGVDAAGSNRDFGSYDFASTLNGGGLDYAVLQPHPTWSQAIRPTFYGPQGQEIGANFNLLMGAPGAPGTVYLDGITVAKKQESNGLSHSCRSATHGRVFRNIPGCGGNAGGGRGQARELACGGCVCASRGRARVWRRGGCPRALRRSVTGPGYRDPYRSALPQGNAIGAAGAQRRCCCRI